MRSNDHYLPLMLNAKLKMALIKLQADKELGQSYAGLLALVEGLHQLKYLSEEDYQIYVKRYSKKLVDEPQQKLIPEVDPQAIQEIEGQTRYFSMVLDQWHLHPKPEWRRSQVRKAQVYAGRIKAADLILDLAKKETI